MSPIPAFRHGCQQIQWKQISRKCQFSIQQCGQTPTLSLNSVCKIKEHACFHTQKEKSPGWRANTQRALLHTQRFLSDLAIRDHPTSPPPPPHSLCLFLPVFLIFWLQIERDRQYKNTSIWLLTEKKLKMYSVPSALWLMNNVGWWGGNCIENRANWYWRFNRSGLDWKMLSNEVSAAEVAVI